MPYRFLLAIVLALGVTLASTPAEVQASADPVVDVGDAEITAIPEVAPIARPMVALAARDVVTLRPLDASPPPVPPPEP